jgi:hypothetical protein
VVTPLQYLFTCSDKVYEKRAAKLLEQVQHCRRVILVAVAQQQEQEQSSTAATAVILPIHRASLYGSQIREYYSYGHDDITSTLQAGEPANYDKVSAVPSCPVLSFANFPDRNLGNLAILFGGMGDA